MEANTYVNIKMRTGEDLVAIFEEENDEYVTIRRPLHIMVHPHRGFFVKSWNLLSTGVTVNVRHDDLIWLDEANNEAVRYYTQFLEEIDNNDYEAQTVDEFHNEVEDALEAIWESKSHTKH